MAKNEKKKDIGELSFEEAIEELNGIVGKIEEGAIPLQDSLEQYEKGMALINRCKDILEKAERRIEKISKTEPKIQEETEAETQQEAEDVPF
jgi:exodeoxyribonuclease VII small subunit